MNHSKESNFTLEINLFFFAMLPRHAMILWLLARGRLNTLDRLTSFAISQSLTCPLCKGDNENLSDLLFSCQFYNRIWHSLFGMSFLLLVFLVKKAFKSDSEHHPLPFGSKTERKIKITRGNRSKKMLFELRTLFGPPSSPKQHSRAHPKRHTHAQAYA